MVSDRRPRRQPRGRRGPPPGPAGAAPLRRGRVGDGRPAGVAVAGTHGKTTTTSLLTVALQAAGADPSYAIGGDLAQTGTNAAEGSSDLFVAEADESDGAFLVYRPHAAVVTNVEADHLDQWGSEEAYRAAFTEFVGRIEPDGFLVCCADDPGAAALADVARDRGLAAYAVGEADTADVRCVDLAFAGETSAFTVVDGGAELGRVTLRIPGRHYVLDALAALAVGLRLGYGFDDLRRGLEGFTGTRRRMERKGEAGGVRVYDSYAHHPAEIAGDLQAARAVAGDGRVVVVFQPHLVSRTRLLRRGDGGGSGRRRRGGGPRRLPRPRGRRPGRHRGVGGRRRPAPAGAGRLRARPASGLLRARSSGPGPVTWCSPSARAPSPSSVRGSSSCWRARDG